MHTAHDYNYILVFKICQGVLLTFTKLPCEPCSTLRDSWYDDYAGGGALHILPDHKPQPTDKGADDAAIYNEGDDAGDDTDGLAFPAQ